MRRFWIIPFALFLTGCGSHDSDADHRTAAIKSRAEQAFSAVAQTVAALDKHDFANAADFETNLSASPVIVLSWAPLVRQADRGDKLILQPTADNHLIPMEEREDYLPILYQERTDGEPLTLGFDLQALPDRKAVIRQARDTHTPIMLQPPKRAFRATAMPVYSILWPVYRDGAYIGVVSGLAPADKMLDFLVKDAPPLKGSVAFFSRHGENPANDVPVMIWRSGKFVAASEPLGPPPAGATRVQRQFNLNGLDWLLVFDYSEP